MHRTPKSKRKRMIWIVIGIIVLLAIFQLSAVIVIESYQYAKNKELISSLKKVEQNSKTLVVYFSRSGNTELMAYTIAEIKKGELINLVAEDYKIGFVGWINAMADARKISAVIKPQKIDLSKYDTIYIGAPIWLYSPAPPVFEFASKNDFTNKKVVLFNSLNSRFEQKYIDKFSNIVKQKGGTFIQHIYVNRGRMTQQMSTQDFVNTIKGQI